MTITNYKPNGSLANSVAGWDWEKMINNFFNDSLCGWEGRHPAVDVREEEEQYVMEAELPGLADKDINVHVEDSLLTISSQQAEEKEAKKHNFLLRERSRSSFTRSFVLPKNASKEEIEAHFKDGILRLTIKKLPEAKPKQIEVKTN
jgi:HSP20 family molecular chaperone IbpA